MEHLDFMVNMGSGRRKDFKKNVGELIDKFEIDTSYFEKVTQSKIDGLVQTGRDLDQSLAMIEATKNQV